jgi:hypothetical protein
MSRPAFDTAHDHVIDAFEYGSRLAKGIGNVAAAQPFVEQVNLAANFGCELDYRIDMTLFHAKHEIGLKQHGSSQLMGAMRRAIDAVFAKEFQDGCVHGIADERDESRATQLDAASTHPLPEQVFGRWTATDVAHANDQYPLKHGASTLPD